MKEPTAMLYIGGTPPSTVKAAAEAIVAVLKAAGTEATSVEAMKTLAALAQSTTSANIHDCTFTHNPDVPKRKSR